MKIPQKQNAAEMISQMYEESKKKREEMNSNIEYKKEVELDFLHNKDRSIATDSAIYNTFIAKNLTLEIEKLEGGASSISLTKFVLVILKEIGFLEDRNDLQDQLIKNQQRYIDNIGSNFSILTERIRSLEMRVISSNSAHIIKAEYGGALTQEEYEESVLGDPGLSAEERWKIEQGQISRRGNVIPIVVIEQNQEHEDLVDELIEKINERNNS